MDQGCSQPRQAVRHYVRVTAPTRSRRAGWTVLCLIATFVGVGCSPGEDAVETGCASTVRDASAAVEVADQVRLLDLALVRCRSIDELTTEMNRYPGITGYDLQTFVELRCSRVSDESVRSSPACMAVTATTAVPTTQPSEIVYVGATLDGRTIELRPGGATVFVGDTPQVVQQTVDIAVESGCVGVLAQRDHWAALVDDPTTGDEASVYAQHAQNVANYIGCESTPIPTAPPATG